MATVWIVHRDPRVRSALARLVGDEANLVLGGPTDRLFESVGGAELVLLGLSGPMEAELDFAHRFTERLAGTPWLLVAEGSSPREIERLFDALDAEVLPYPPAQALLRRRVRAALRPRPPEALSFRRERERLGARFARWFGDLELPDLVSALDARHADVPLLVRGERGSGRALLARYVHAYGGGRRGRFVPVACSGMANAAELERAIADALHGAAGPPAPTLCLEDVDHLPAVAQAQLCAWLETGAPDVLGVPRLRLCATAGEEDHDGLGPILDDDLAQVLAGIAVRIPPLRERVEAIPELARAALEAWCAARGVRPRRISDAALDVLCEYPWPGNRRELEAVLARSLAASSADPLEPGHLRLRSGPSLAVDTAEPRADRPRAPVAAPEPALAPEESGPETRTEAEPEAGPDPPPPATGRFGAPPVPLQPAEEADAREEPAEVDEDETAPPEEELARPRLARLEDAPERALAMDESDVRRLVGAIAHEVRNPLVTVRTFTELLPERFDDPEFRARFGEVVGGDVRRIERAVEQLSRLAGLSTPERELVDVAELLETLLDERRESLERSRLVVLKELEAGRCAARGDPEQLRFAFDALLGKALESVPDGGSVYVAARGNRATAHSPATVRVLLRFRGPAGSTSAVLDGLAFSDTALEVTVAEAIVRMHGGSVTVNPHDPRETLVLIDLPA